MRATITTTKWIILLLFLMTSVLFAAGGKIAGRVTDQETGESLPGVNVIIEGTTMGAATDLNGNYVILNVPAGTYRIHATFIGYAEYKVSNVRVHIGQTTRLNSYCRRNRHGCCRAADGTTGFNSFPENHHCRRDQSVTGGGFYRRFGNPGRC
jgi:hypothetical protein